MTKPTHPRCGWCESLPHGCPTPQACEQAEEERSRSRSNTFLVAAALLVAALGTLVLIHWRSL